MYLVDLLWLPVMVGWPYVIGVQWDPVAQFLWSPELSAPDMSLVWFMWALFFVIESWLLLSHSCMRSTPGWLTVRIYLKHSIQASVQVLTTWSKICLSRLWCLPRSPFGYSACEPNWILLWSCLKMAITHVGSVASWDALWCRPMSDTACGWPWTTCLELQSNPLFVAASTGPGVLWTDQAAQ